MEIKEEMLKTIDEEIKKTPIILYMKGSKEMPRCGFSARVVEILQTIGCEFVVKDVLEDESLRSAIKEYSDWPTIPQLYIHGEFIGGCDIVQELYERGDLQSLLYNE